MEKPRIRMYVGRYPGSWYTSYRITRLDGKLLCTLFHKNNLFGAGFSNHRIIHPNWTPTTIFNDL